MPPALCRYLTELGHDAEHVVDIGLGSSSDQTVGDFAAATSAIIVTKDQDFLTMRALRNEGPTILWVRIGNTTTSAPIDAFSHAWPEIISALGRGESVVELA